MMKEALKNLGDKYDFVLIDCAPSLGLLTLNALTAADSVMIPIQCEYFALEGLGKLLNTVKSVQKIHNNDLDIEGMLLTMYDSRLRLSNQVVEEVKKQFEKNWKILKKLRTSCNMLTKLRKNLKMLKKLRQSLKKL